MSVAPDRSELEVSVFGRGRGECVLLHVGGGDWIVVDSCRGSDDKAPIALTYLSSIGVDPAVAVKYVIVSHWHDDHIAGVAEVLRKTQAARFGCSSALRTEEFLKLVASGDERRAPRSGIDEFVEVLRILRERGQAPKWLKEHCLLHRSGEAEEVLGIEAWALSPSDASFTRAIESLARLLPAAGARIGAVPNPTPNQLSVVLHVRCGMVSVLLGGDLEASSDTAWGWKAAVSAAESLGVGSVQIVKVPHHGASNAYDSAMWSKLVGDEDPHAVVTTFLNGNRTIPTNEDLERLRTHSDYVHVAQRAARTRPRRRANPVEKEMDKSSRSRWLLESECMGHVRLRVNCVEPKAKVDVMYGGGACLLA